jgi:hypothetical protein
VPDKKGELIDQVEREQQVSPKDEEEEVDNILNEIFRKHSEGYWNLFWKRKTDIMR